ncbi:MAG: hypothetical protein R3Y53_04535 [Bacillota bacterium]
MNKLKMREQQMAWNEGCRLYFLEKAYKIKEPFYREFFVQCIESTSADFYELFFEMNAEHNCFLKKKHIAIEVMLLRFYKLVAIHHTIRVATKKKKIVSWDTMKLHIYQIFQCDEKEKAVAELLYQSAKGNYNEFQRLIIKVLVRYVFDESILDGFSFAFLGNFWYNSYRNFMASFVKYVPFVVRFRRGVGDVGAL